MLMDGLCVYSGDCVVDLSCALCILKNTTISMIFHEIQTYTLLLLNTWFLVGNCEIGFLHSGDYTCVFGLLFTSSDSF